MIRDLYRDEPRVKVQAYDCLTTDFALQMEASLIIRGIRTVKDFDRQSRPCRRGRRHTSRRIR